MIVEEWNPSPNFSSRNGRKINTIVDHVTQGNFPGCVDWLKNPVSVASAHYVVTKLGRIIQLVKEGDKAWANGTYNHGSWDLYDGTNPNLTTLSIEHEGLTGEPFTEAQYQATLFLHRELIAKYSLPIDEEHIIGHYRLDSVNKSNCPGSGFPWVRLFSDLRGVPVTIVRAPEPSRGSAPTPILAPPVASFPLSFSYPNNAKVVGDDLYIRDGAGNRIAGRYVSNGDNITVLDVSYSRQLALVEYPTPAGVRKGYVANVVSCIQYYNQDKWLNGSTSEPVLDENGGALGSLNPREKATPLYRKNGKLHVVYATAKGINTKSGYVAWDGGFSKF